MDIAEYRFVRKQAALTHAFRFGSNCSVNFMFGYRLSDMS